MGVLMESSFRRLAKVGVVADRTIGERSSEG